ncbi:MAG: hypothetical protein DHS80DRAFT_30588 [Piptocephalis tieghemiana]|nr:MAG: hypothetical protein DHS80DRAFT_30588 [Piptocephalis tieghemiana]
MPRQVRGHGSMSRNRPRAQTHSPSSQGPSRVLLGPPRAISKVTPVILPAPLDETPSERAYRIRCRGANERHEEFWHRNNTLFTSQLSRVKALEDPEALTAFYQKFAIEQQSSHRAYTLWWWKENFILLGLAIRARLSRWSTGSRAVHKESYFDGRDVS